MLVLFINFEIFMLKADRVGIFIGFIVKFRRVEPMNDVYYDGNLILVTVHSDLSDE